MKISLVCSQCGNTFERERSNVNQGMKDGYQRTYCSNECKYKGMNTKVSTVCSKCGKTILVRRGLHEKSKQKRFFCCHSCAAAYNNLGVRRHGEPVEKPCRNCGKMTRNKTWCERRCKGEFIWKGKREKIEKAGLVSFGVEEHNRRMAKRFLTDTQGHLCVICGLTEWMGKPIPLVLDHIDGNAVNYTVGNLRLVCGNCNMQLSTFAGRNKGHGTRSKKPHI